MTELPHLGCPRPLHHQSLFLPRLSPKFGALAELARLGQVGEVGIELSWVFLGAWG